MKLKQMLALAMALILVVALAACGKSSSDTAGSSDDIGTTDSTNQSATTVYSVTVADVMGNPYSENIIVLFLQNGEQVAMQPVNNEGAASKELPTGTYDVQLQITQGAERYYYAEGQQVTAENPALNVVLSNVAEEDSEVLSVSGLERYLYKLVVTPASEGAGEGTFQLEDYNGELDGTYTYVANEEGGYDVLEDANMFITLNLDGTFAFHCSGLNYGQVMEQEGEATGTLSGTYNVAANEYEAPYVNTGCTYLELDTNERNFLIFVPTQSGIFEFTVHNATASIGYYGSPYFVLLEDAGTATGTQSMTVEVKESMIGTDGAGTAQLVIGIDSADENCIVSIVRVGDCVLTPVEMPWDIYEGTDTPSKYTLPAGLTIQEFDLTAASDAYTLVYNEADGFYHLGSADGAVVLVRMNAVLSYGACFGDMLAGMNVGVYFYEEDGTFIRKELYNDCLLQYLGTLNKGMGTHSYTGGMLDDTYGVYPLTNDLMYIIQTYGAYTGWWTTGSSNYLFSQLVDVNPEIAWLFMCCYAQ